MITFYKKVRELATKCLDKKWYLIRDKIRFVIKNKIDRNYHLYIENLINLIKNECDFCKEVIERSGFKHCHKCLLDSLICDVDGDHANLWSYIEYLSDCYNWKNTYKGINLMIKALQNLKNSGELSNKVYKKIKNFIGFNKI